MNFALSLALREMRSSWKRLLFFFLCVGVGVGSIVALRSVVHNLNDALAGEARTLLAADVQVDSTRPWQPETLQTIARVAAAPLVEARTETIESPTMIRPADESQDGAIMIELKGIESPFPLFGDFKLANNVPFDHSLLAGNGAIVAPLVLERLRLNVGDAVKIGTSTFQIRGVLEREPGASTGFRLGPRVYVERAAVENAGLTGFGSRARRRLLFRTEPGRMETLVAALRGELKNTTGVGVRSYKESQDNLRDQFARAENYLSLTGLVVLVLGGIGVSNVTRVFIEQKKRTIAVLKCLGGTGRQITAAYLLQVTTLGLAGSVLGVILARAALYAVEVYFARTLPPNMSYSLQTSAILQGLAMGLLVSILFSALPLLRIRGIKPRLLLREADGQGEGGRRKIDLPLWATAAFCTLGLVLLASWQAGSLRV
ncbi:MAG TPA: FtsX-like permease family protein, partial [Pyrinomonadaceae bacterium]|nr:FtsX-like permease family protein [Pyrinomonadaceae bacterium]